MTASANGRIGGMFALLAAGALASGCVSSPTYGTDKTSGAQLMGDVSGILSIAPKRRDPIDYKPRPELVKPAKGANLPLPTPQDDIETANAGAWPESPEQKRARLRADATENSDKPGWQPQIENDISLASTVSRTKPLGASDRLRDAGLDTPNTSSPAQRAEVQRRLAENRQGSQTTRKYLSDPPLTYRQPSDTAPVGDVGEDEAKKERRLKAEAKKKSGGSKWADLWPF